MIKTTLNMNIKTLAALTNAAQILNCSRTYLIKLLMGKIKSHNKQFITLFSIVKYQDRDLKKNWRKFHISLSDSEYEHFIDMRKLFKKSVSRYLTPYFL